MATIKPCNNCGERISIRKMPAGHWVAFDVTTNSPHQCTKKSPKKENSFTEITSNHTIEEQHIINRQENESFDANDYLQKDIDDLENLKNRSSKKSPNENNQNNNDKIILFILAAVILFFIFK